MVGDDDQTISRKELREILGEAFHTSLRKASEHPKADEAWKALRELPNEDLVNVIEFALDGIFGIKSLTPKP